MRTTVQSAAVLLFAFALFGQAAFSQDVSGGIVIEDLEPLDPAEGANAPGSELQAEDDRFKPAPFKTDAPARAPIMIEPVETAERPGATLRQLDKMTGRTQTFTIAAGDEQTVERLRVRLASCRSPEDNARHGTMALLQIWDNKRQAGEAVFSGWMFAESPALSAMDHQRYDVWVINCTTSAGDTAAANE